MPTVQVLDMTGKKVGEIELDELIFGIQPNTSAMHTMVVNHLANRRQGTQSTLTRTEVNGGGRKPWRQKGTGRARQGSTRAPHWTHGGVALGPKPRSYRFAVNKKLRRLALKSALSSKVLGGDIIVIDELKMNEIKTKQFVGFLGAVGAANALVVTAAPVENVIKSARNIEGIATTIAPVLNVYDVLNHRKLIVDKSAVACIEEVYA